MEAYIDSPNRPTKPPRNKGSKETGILMRVIKTLSIAASTEHRDRERTKLEKDFKKSDAKLDTLLSQHQTSLSSVMQLFSNVCGEIQTTKDKIKSVKGNLQQCKMLLQCRREELQRLWLEGVEHKHALQIFDQIEKLREGSDNFTKLLNRKQYMPAVEVLMGCLQGWNQNLDQIEGLNDLHTELKLKRDKMYETLKEELYHEMYHNFSKEPFEKRQGSGAYFSRGGSDRLSGGKMSQIKARKIVFDFGQHAGNFVKTAESHESDSFIITIVDCMIRLDEVTRFVKDLRHNIEEKLMEVVNAAAQHIIEYGDASGAIEPDSALFKQLIQLIFTQFRSIVRSHTLIIRHLETALGKTRQVKIHDEQYLWTRVQFVLQSTLKIYFGLSDSKADGTITGSEEFMDTTTSINSYFVKRKPQRMKRPLFKFKYSMHGLNVNDYVVQGSDNNRAAMDRHRFLVCKPSPKNIIAIYAVVQELCSEIEQTTNEQKCELRKFMGNNVNKVFVQQIYKEISESVEAAKKNPESWKECISLDGLKTGIGTHPRPLLQSVVHIGRNVQEVIRLANELPTHCDQLIRMLLSILSSYLDACRSSYQAIIQPSVDDKAVISSSWVRDTDIQRLLKSLPNWLKLVKAKESKNNQSIDDSPEDVQNANLRESELLTGLFYGKTVLKHEIISDTKRMNQLAHLQESLEWFANQIKAAGKSFERIQNLDAETKEQIEGVYEIAASFSDLADVCLLVLQLEVRVHCFHFLIPMAQNGDFSPGIDSQNSDPEVNKLVRDVSHIHNILSASLQPVKNKYIFEGIGQLIATILIGCVEHIQRINDNGVKKMCRNIFAVQKTLSDITHHPEQGMDHARQFYELFTQTPEDIVNGILEKGPQFKELEYMNALKLIFRSKPGQKTHSLEEHLNRLSNILGDVGVVV